LHHSRTRSLPYTPAQLFALVSDVEGYPEFLPWISRLRTWNRRTEGEGVQLLDAEATVKFTIISEKFSSRIRLDERAMSIDVGLISGPFRKLRTEWRFRPAPEGAELSFDIDFEFGSKLLEGLFAANFQKAVASIVKRFEARAAQLYG
jgi:coenzyme Q-binding protein COQ10